MSPVSESLDVVRVLVRAGVLRPEDPLTFVRAAAGTRRWGRGLAGAAAANAVRHGRRIAMIDELGPISHLELHERSGALAARCAPGESGPATGSDCSAATAATSRCGALATAKLGADLVLLNTSFSGPQLRDVLEREGARA